MGHNSSERGIGGVVDVGMGVVWGNRGEKSYNKRKTYEGGMCRTYLESSESVGEKSGAEGYHPQTRTSRS